MNEFDKRVSDIYPPSLISFSFVTILTIVAEILLFNPEYILNPGASITILIWLYVAISSIDTIVIRRHIYTKSRTNKKDLIAFLEHRLQVEKRKIRIIRRNKGEIIQENIKALILGLKKAKIEIESE